MIAMLLSVIVAAGGLDSFSSELLRAAVDPNPALRSYTASATLVARVHAGISVSHRFSGKAYYAKPVLRVVFDNVPAALRRFRILDTTVPTFAQANEDYEITLLTNDSRLAIYQLVPKNAASRIMAITISIEDRTALITSAEWKYRDAGTVRFQQTYATMGGFCLPSTIVVAARFPAYGADGIVRLTDFQLNVDVPPTAVSN